MANLPPDGFVVLIGMAVVALEWLEPLGVLPEPALLGAGTLIGVPLLLIGLGLEVAAASALRRAGTTTAPGASPAALVVDGPYRFSRNPFYIGLLLVVAGLSLCASLDWMLLGLPLLWLAIERIVVPGEEHRLAAAMPDAWPGYAARVRRWL